MRTISTILIMLVLGLFLRAQEPAPPAPAPAAGETTVPAQEPKPLTADALKKSIKAISTHEYQMGEMIIDVSTKTLRFPASVKITRGPLEYLVVNEKGSAHEALFITTLTPFEIHIGMLLMGVKPSETFFTKATAESFPEVNPGAVIGPESRFDAIVEWKDADGKPQSARADSWVKNVHTKQPMSDESWIYNGSILTDRGDLAAQQSGNLIALFIDPISLANNPRKDHEKDDIWESNPLLTKEGHPVTLAFRMSGPKNNQPKKPTPKSLPKDSSPPTKSANTTKTKP